MEFISAWTAIIVIALLVIATIAITLIAFILFGFPEEPGTVIMLVLCLVIGITMLIAHNSNQQTTEPSTTESSYSITLQESEEVNPVAKF